MLWSCLLRRRVVDPTLHGTDTSVRISSSLSLSIHLLHNVVVVAVLPSTPRRRVRTARALHSQSKVRENGRETEGKDYK